MDFGELLAHPLSRFLAQVVAIIVVSRLLGVLMKRIGQPMVIAEISAGIILGPSLFGLLAPDAWAILFAPASLPVLQMMAQVGLVLFMFLVGLELDPALLRGRGRASLAISWTSIVLPFALGIGLAFFLKEDYADPGVRFSAFALFMGAAMSITAFPVLARILAERRLLSTRVGAITIACAAVDDVTAWCILAFVVAVSRSAAVSGAITTTSLAVGYIVLMVFVVRPFLVRLAARVASPEGVSQNAVAIALVLVFVSAWTTEAIGIHALFGAFLFGAVLPKEGGFARAMAEKLEDVVLIVLLPLFFAFSGLRTEIGLVDTPQAWMVCGVIILAACTGKFGGSALAARLTGLRWREASALGILMNTRGLMELVVLNIGLDLGVISPTVFSMMVMMALFTTFITTPLIRWIYPPEAMMAAEAMSPADSLQMATPVPSARAETMPPFRVMACISYEEAGPGLVSMAAALLHGEPRARIYVVHLVPASNRGSPFVGEDIPPGTAVLGPALERAADLAVDARKISFVSSDPADDLCDVATQRRIDLVLIGIHKPVFSQTLLGGVVHEVLSEIAPTVGVFVDRGGGAIRRVLVPFQGSEHDRAALGLAHRLMRQGAEVTVLHVVAPGRAAHQGAGELVDSVFAEGAGQVRLKVIEHQSPEDAALAESAADYDLVVVGVGRAWGLGDRPLGLGITPEPLIKGCPTSLLVVRGPSPEASPLAQARLSAMTQTSAAS